MMPGIAIRPDFPIAAAPAGRMAAAAAGDGFSKALHDRPNASARADGKAEQPAQGGASDGGGDIAATSIDGKKDKVGKAPRAGDSDDGHADGGAKKDKDDEEGGALPPQLTAQRVLAGQWPAATPAAARDGATAAPEPTSGPGASPPQSVSTVQGNAGPAIHGQAINDMTGAASVLPSGGAAVQPAVAAAMQAPATVAQTGKDASPPPPAVDNADPAPTGVSVSSAATAEAASPSAAFMARVAALDHGDKPASATPGAASASPTASDGNAAQAKPAQAPAGQGPGEGGANPDSRGDGNDGAQNKAVKSMAQPSASTGGGTPAAPLPTAQMVPSSGSASSFAAALADGGRLARYVASASAAAANGVPAPGLPVQSLRIQLQPVTLGTVTANLKYAGGLLSIDIEVQNPDAQRRLSSDSSDIVKSLQSLGFQVDKLTVRQIQPQSQAQAQGQPQGQATAQDGSAGRFGGQGGNPFSASGHPERQASQHRQGSESGNEDASERGIGAIRPAADRHQPRRGVFI
jgi:chemotaxis protein MotD